MSLIMSYKVDTEYRGDIFLKIYSVIQMTANSGIYSTIAPFGREECIGKVFTSFH